VWLVPGGLGSVSVGSRFGRGGMGRLDTILIKPRADILFIYISADACSLSFSLEFLGRTSSCTPSSTVPETADSGAGSAYY
jgi:hypothetical protein